MKQPASSRTSGSNRTSGTSAATDTPRFLEDLRRIAGELSASLREVLSALPGGVMRPVDLAKRYSLNKDVASRMIKASQSLDPLAAAHIVPGPEPMRAFLKSASSSVPTAVASRAQAALGAFDHFIAERAGDRSALDAIISTYLTDVRERHELVAKQTAFKGMSLVKGVSAEVMQTSYIVWPNAHKPGRLDRIIVNGIHGLQGMRAGSGFCFQSEYVAGNPSATRLTLKRTPVERIEDLCLWDFCSRPFAKITPTTLREAVIYSIAPKDVGRDEAVDYVIAELVVNSGSMHRHVGAPGADDAWFAGMITIPSRLLLLDVLVHRDVFPDATPYLRQHDTAVRGTANCNDRVRDIDLLNFSEKILHCGRGIECLRSRDVPRHVESLRHIFSQAGLNAEEFRSYRVQVEYPVYGGQYSIVMPRFERPESSRGSSGAGPGDGGPTTKDDGAGSADACFMSRDEGRNPTG